MRRTLVAVGFLTLLTLFIYRDILIGPGSSTQYPWASDTLGHVLKAEYMQRQMLEGQFYPDILPNWYMGLQMLRYHPPLPYYLLVGVALFTGNFVAAANWLIAVCALVGGVSWLLYHRWIGWLPATIGGALFLFLPDNIRVALAEGNLPRVTATALLPLSIYFLLRLLEEKGTRWHFLGLALCLALIVITHAMMAAIYAACAVLLAFLYFVLRQTTMRRMLLIVTALILGMGLSGWWLLPSLSGGITELDSSALTEAQAVFSLTTYLNPILRRSNPEIVYVGAALLIVTAAALFITRAADKRIIALTLTGLFGVLITTPGFNTLFNSLPLHGLFWPLRFLGIASFALLLALMWRFQEWGRQGRVWSILIVLVLAADGWLSSPLIHLRPARKDLLEVSPQLARLNGWREATLDYSRLGSAASYFFTADGGREQVYGWAYQGARTARNVSSLNESLRTGFTAYTLDRLTLLGVDDVVLLNSPEVDAKLPKALQQAGLNPVYNGREVTLYHRDGGPRAYVADWPVLGIGRGAQNLAYAFPQLIGGTSIYVDDYTLAELSQYDTVVLSGFNWHNQEQAETLVKEAAQAGARVVVDLTGVPIEPLAREPLFLDVWGERIILSSEETYSIQQGEHAYQLQPFSLEFPLWQAYTPQGLQVETATFNYLGETGAVLGYNEYDGAPVWFIGLNLPYHIALTQDPAAIALLADVLGLPPHTPSAYTAVPLEDYSASEDGYAFNYTLNTPDTLLVPIAFLEGIAVTIDGQPVEARSLETLLVFDAPAGRHMVGIGVQPTGIYRLGKLISVLSLLGLIFIMVKGTRLAQRQVVGEVSYA